MPSIAKTLRDRFHDRFRRSWGAANPSFGAGRADAVRLAATAGHEIAETLDIAERTVQRGLGEGAADSRGGAALKLKGPMALSIPQMARMSQLLEEALGLDEPARRAWVERLPLEHQDLAPALRRALLPEEGQAEYLQALLSLPKLRWRRSGKLVSGPRPAARRTRGAVRADRLLGAGGMAKLAGAACRWGFQARGCSEATAARACAGRS